jgi:hypothetical protein
VVLVAWQILLKKVDKKGIEVRIGFIVNDGIALG